jgi:5-methyltetrahydropteroyltriglutamate--homocysteine methyltransferase
MITDAVGNPVTDAVGYPAATARETLAGVRTQVGIVGAGPGPRGSYEFVAEALFSRLDVDGFLLEYDDARSGGFAPLRFVPPGKRVVLGLVTTKRPELESKDDLKRRIDEAARYAPIEQLCLSPQCGFSSTVEGNNLTREQQVAKLSLIVETAAEVWG